MYEIFKRMKMKILVAVLFLVSASGINAGIRASFSLSYCSWNATDIVVATEGEEIDGNFTVLESLKGSLYTGETISISKLSAFKSESSRLIEQSGNNADSEPLKYVTGSKMILFLKKKTGSKDIWESADIFGEINASVLWLENDKPFAFVQIVNPGASLLVEYGESESEIRNGITETLQIRNSFDSATEIKNKVKRAEALAQFTFSEQVFIRQSAFTELRQCGKDALPVLRKILNDDLRLDIHSEAIKSLTKVGGEGVGKELTAIVKNEMNFWKATAPRLKKEWWNDFNNPETENLRNHYGKVLEAIYQLRILKFAGSKNAVAQFRNFWHSTPQLENKNGLSQMTEECDNLLKELFQESP